MKNVNVNGVDYSGVSQVQLKTTEGGTALFKDVDEIVTPSGVKTITENGTYDVTNFATLVANIAGGGSDNVYVSNYGAVYVENMVIPNVVVNGVATFTKRYMNCDKMKTVEVSGEIDTKDPTTTNAFAGCTSLESAVIKNFRRYGHYWFDGCTALKTVQLGSIGCPVSSLEIYTFRNCTQSGLEITIYVADDATLPLEKSPFGATNATIVYRSATTGNVITV